MHSDRDALLWMNIQFKEMASRQNSWYSAFSFKKRSRYTTTTQKKIEEEIMDGNLVL